MKRVEKYKLKKLKKKIKTYIKINKKNVTFDDTGIKKIQISSN